MTCTVAVLGVGGIGRHHANWWRQEGAEVVAILGRSPESVRKSAARLKELTGFDGAVYTDLGVLLREARPDIVDICTPAPCHAAQALQALQDGRRVLCEKPLVFDPALDEEALLAQADAVVQLAQARGLDFCLC